MKRSGFLAMLAALPFIGALIPKVKRTVSYSQFSIERAKNDFPYFCKHVLGMKQPYIGQHWYESAYLEIRDYNGMHVSAYNLSVEERKHAARFVEWMQKHRAEPRFVAVDIKSEKGNAG